MLPELFAFLGRSQEPGGVSKMLGQLRSWLASGAYRIKADPAPTQYRHAAAVASMDELYSKVLESLFDPLFAAGGTFPAAVTSRLCPSTTVGLNRVRSALLGTYAALVQANDGRADVASWTADSNTAAASAAAGHEVTLPQYDSIAFRAVGVVGQPHSDWQNRPTFQQVVMFPGHRPRG